jgi:hypothetical protein
LIWVDLDHKTSPLFAILKIFHPAPTVIDSFKTDGLINRQVVPDVCHGRAERTTAADSLQHGSFALSSTDGSNADSSSPVVDCNSRSDASRAWTLSRYATIIRPDPKARAPTLPKAHVFGLLLISDVHQKPERN